MKILSSSKVIRCNGKRDIFRNGSDLSVFLRMKIKLLNKGMTANCFCDKIFLVEGEINQNLMTSSDDYLGTYEQAVSYYRFAIINHIGFHDKLMLLTGSCGNTNGNLRLISKSFAGNI